MVGTALCGNVGDMALCDEGGRADGMVVGAADGGDDGARLVVVCCCVNW